ncbi:MAG TPA: hypothetical protein VGQ06_09865 [Gemmatimonadales bacterium]|jgi:hypothetical protein|nr:hypothetical protein [Gemmatimonadales bacterium]
MTGQPPALERAALSRELADFLIELSIALHKHAMYPQGHPSLAPAAAGVLRRVEHLLENRTTVSLGVARLQLVIEGVATDPKHPVLAELAGRLHRHHLGAVTFRRGVRGSDVADALRTLAVEAERTGEPLGLGSPDRLRIGEHIRLHPLTYERLELLDEGGAPPPEQGEAGARGVRGAQLWVGLARAALAADAGADDAPPPAAEPAAIAQAIDQHPRSAAYDQVIVGYLLQIAEELKDSGGAEAAALRRRTSRLVGALQPATLRRLIEMGGDAAQRRKFALDATHGLAVDAVLEIVQAMADASHKSVSEPLVRMLSKLAAHAEQGASAVRPQADEALREQVRSLLTGWSLDDPTPDEYGHALHRMAGAAPQFAAPGEASHATEPVRLLQTGLEVGVLGPAVWRGVDQLVAEGRVGTVVDALERAPTAGEEIGQVWDRITAPEAVRPLVGSEPPDFTTLDRLLARLGTPAFEPLLDALAASESRTTRRGLLDRLGRAPSELGAVVATRLARAAPWYVVRNLLTVLDALPGVPAGFTAAPFAAHVDARVRREALKLALKAPTERERTLVGAMRDPDPRTARTALTAALDDCPPAAVPLAIEIAQDSRCASELRVLAIKVIGRSRSSAALEALLALTDGGTTLLGRRKLAARSLELLAALMALATSFARDRRARAVLTLAAASKDPDVRRAADPGTAGP